jgi:hypothetical protein
LISLLQMNFLAQPAEAVTRESLIRELDALRASGAFEHIEDLGGKFADPALDLSFEEIQAITHAHH